MLIRHLEECPEITAGDGCALRELLNAGKGTFAFRYSLAHAVVKPGQTTARHSMKTSEVYYILEGTGRMQIDRDSQDVRAGDTIDIPPHAVQCISNIGTVPLVFLCIVDPAWRKEDETV